MNEGVICYKRKSTNKISCGYYKDFKEMRRFESTRNGKWDKKIWDDFIILKEADVRSKLGYMKFVKKCHQHNWYDRSK